MIKCIKKSFQCNKSFNCTRIHTTKPKPLYILIKNIEKYNKKLILKDLEKLNKL